MTLKIKTTQHETYVSTGRETNLTSFADCPDGLSLANDRLTNLRTISYDSVCDPLTECHLLNLIPLISQCGQP